MQPTKVDLENSIAQELIADADLKTIKRGEWEAFEFELEAPGIVRVTNESYADSDEHSYLVNVEDDVPVACECPAFRHQEGPCKHLVAVAIREPVLQAATAARDDCETAMLADGGEVVEQVDGDHDGAEDACRNGQVGCSLSAVILQHKPPISQPLTVLVLLPYLFHASPAGARGKRLDELAAALIVPRRVALTRWVPLTSHPFRLGAGSL